MNSYSVEDLALAYELRQSGCCWKRIALGLGGDDRLLCAAVSHLVRHGIRKGLDGYARRPGRRAVVPLDLLRAARQLREAGMCWRSAGEHLQVDPGRLRKAYRYALQQKLI